MKIDIAESIADFSASSWDRLAGDRYPFLRHAFLQAAESNGCVSTETGWRPRHIGIRDNRGKLLGVMPLYEKTHSWGEFVFDWSWAQAYQRAGLEYYPKLVSAAPFTPAQSPRLLATTDEIRQLLIESACELAKNTGSSSLHVQFPLQEELPLFEKSGLKLRKDCQFHWHNQNFSHFEDFLQTFNASKRKKARRDRRHAKEQGFKFRCLRGAELDASVWSDVYELISITFLQRGSLPYFSKEFFIEVSTRCPESILVILAELESTPVAAAVFYDSNDVLYGRYWGSDANYNALHFETCYYQGIDYCIANKRRVFEPGTQGEHKISRGFTPVETWSAHWLAKPEFFAAVGNYLDEETLHIDRYIDAVNMHSPYKLDTPDAQTKPIT
ncbi:MAG: putative N-acyltransferase [Woeseiaceae bacterium]|jgi:predicted N-acyltransferase